MSLLAQVPPPVDLAAFEAWLADPATAAVAGRWRTAGMDLWPLFNTCLASLAIQASMGLRKGRVRIGGRLWQLAVAADLARTAASHRLPAVRPAPAMPSDSLEGRLVWCASAVHARQLGGLTVVAPLDVPATLLRRAGYDGVLWLDDVAADDPRLAHSLSYPARGLAELTGVARQRSWRPGLVDAVRALPGFEPWCRTAASALGLDGRFLALWLARQAGLALASADSFAALFAAQGRPRLVVLLNGGFAATAGLTHAARRRAIPVAEIQHGALSAGAAIAPGAVPHFARLDTGPDAFVSWETRQPDDPACLAVGPIGLHLPAVIGAAHATDRPQHAELRRWIGAQQAALADHAAGIGARREVLVSLQPGDDGRWVAPLAHAAGPDVLFWLRRHGADLGSRGASATGTSAGGALESRLASTAMLPLLLGRVRLHLTRFSAVTLEAAAAGVPTLAADRYAEALYGARIRPDLLTLEPNPARLADRLAGLLRGEQLRVGAALPDAAALVPFLVALIERGAANHV